MEPTATLFANALAHRRAGNLGEAEEVYRQILQAEPLQVEALHGLAGIAYQVGQYDQAAEWLGRAAAVREYDPILQSNLGAAYRAAGRMAEAEACYRKALRLRPDLAEAYNNLANILKSQGRRTEALAYYWQAVLARPNYAAAHHNLGLSLLEMSVPDEAATRLREAVRLQPDWAEARHSLNFALAGATVQLLVPEVAVENRQAQAEAAVYFSQGAALGREGRLDESATAFRHALRITPDHAEANLKLGAVLREQGNLELARGYLLHALRLQPDLAEAHIRLGLVLTDEGKLEEAEAAYRFALRLRPNSAAACGHLGILLDELGQGEEARAALEQALLLGPDEPQIQNQFGMLLANQGRFDEARTHFLKATTLQADFAPATFFLARDGYHSFTGDDVARLEQLLRRDSLPPRDRINLHFALGRIHDRAKAFDKAFYHCDQGNAAKREVLRLQGTTFQSAGHAQSVDRLIASFDPEFFRRTRSFGSDSELPVFIVGMPRSGTSLVEQILASHPAVFGGGELRNMKRFVTELPAELSSPAEYPECLDRLGQERSRRLADRYLEGLRRFGGGKLRVTDKMPMNFHHLGLIAALFPRAQIIHCRRDARDVCWSCFFQNFRDIHFACDLKALGMYHSQYERLMTHWREVLPVPMLEVCYEELVEKPERGSREIISFCRLPWNEDCLTFYQTSRSVRTASNMQVREPVYNRSVGYWKNYEAHLGPLFEALTGAPGA